MTKCSEDCTIVLVNLLCMCSEADPLVGWSKPRWWRADATYAAVIAKVTTIITCLAVLHVLTTGGVASMGREQRLSRWSQRLFI